MNSIRILLQSAVDYAGLFPPAALDMAEAVREYEESRRGAMAWALGRFILPVSRLEEFEAQAASMLPEGGAEQPWRLSVLGGDDREHDLELVAAFNARHAGADSGAAVIDAIESKAPVASEIQRAAGIATSRLESYFEVALTQEAPAVIAAIARAGARGKVRTGGLKAGQFPSPAKLARFIRLCAEANLAFKATAGLHHPLRSVHRVSRDPASPSAVMHGFLNVLLAAAFARTGHEPDLPEQVLEDGARESFGFDDDGASWRDERLSIGQLLAARQHSVISFGSCSLQEPWDGLKELNLL